MLIFSNIYKIPEEDFQIIRLNYVNCVNSFLWRNIQTWWKNKRFNVLTCDISTDEGLFNNDTIASIRNEHISNGTKIKKILVYSDYKLTGPHLKEMDR
jgi:hypothetical protein